MRATKAIITKQFIKNVIIASILSVILNVVVLLIVRPIARAPQTFSPFLLDPVIELTFLGVLAAGFVFVGIQRFFPQSYRKIFTWVAIFALIISFIPDILLPYSTDYDNQGATTFIVIILIIMHILTAGIVLWMFNRKSSLNN